MATGPRDEHGSPAGPGGVDAQLSIPLKEYFEALRAADERLLAERDRRYKEVREAEEKALWVKEAADARALQLAEKTQAYKDEKANELREQIASERGLYVTRAELASAVRELQANIEPLAEYVTSAAGHVSGTESQKTEQRLDNAQILQILVLVGLAIGLVISFLHH